MTTVRMICENVKKKMSKKQNKIKDEPSDLDRCPPANNKGGVVLPAQAAGVHVRPQVGVVPQHVGDPLLCAEVVDFNPLIQTAL